MNAPPALQVYALTKERDALKRGNEKLGDYTKLVHEKDETIKQVSISMIRRRRKCSWRQLRLLELLDQE